MNDKNNDNSVCPMGNGEIDPEKLVSKIFSDMIAKSRTIIVPNVAISVGQNLKGLYVIGNTLNSFLNEQGAIKNAKPGDQIYKVDVYKVK